MAKLSVEELKKRQKAAMGKNGAEPKPAPFSAQEPAVDDQATTNELPLKPAAPVAPKPAAKPRSPDDTKTTLEMDLNQQKDLAARSASDEPPPASVAAPVAVPAPPRVPAVVRRAEPSRRAEAIADPDESPAPVEKPPEKKDLAKEVVEMLKPILSKLLGEKIGEAETKLAGRVDEVSSRVDTLQEGLADLGSNVEAIATEIEGSDEHDGDVLDVDGEGNVTERRPSIRKALSSVGGRVDDMDANVSNIVAEIMGTEDKDGDIIEEGEGGKPQRRASVWKAISGLGERSDSTESALRRLLGKDYGRLQSIVTAHEILTRKVVVRALRSSEYMKEVESVAIEQEPETVKSILEAFADKDVVRLSLAQEQKSSIEKLDDPKLLADPQVKRLHDWVNEKTPELVKRARECLDTINWEACEEANRKMIYGGDE